jgi:hypothetical protein
MLKTFKKYFEAHRRIIDATQLSQAIPSVTRNTSPTNKHGNRRVEILDAVNGKLIEIAHRKSPQHDWEVTLYMVRDDESLADAIATALCVTGGA